MRNTPLTQGFITIAGVIPMRNTPLGKVNARYVDSLLELEYEFLQGVLRLNA
jgi:hypothetical protein